MAIVTTVEEVRFYARHQDIPGDARVLNEKQTKSWRKNIVSAAASAQTILEEKAEVQGTIVWAKQFLAWFDEHGPSDERSIAARVQIK